MATNRKCDKKGNLKKSYPVTRHYINRIVRAWRRNPCPNVSKVFETFTPAQVMFAQGIDEEQYRVLYANSRAYDRIYLGKHRRRQKAVKRQQHKKQQEQEAANIEALALEAEAEAAYNAAVEEAEQAKLI